MAVAEEQNLAQASREELARHRAANVKRNEIAWCPTCPIAC